LFSIKNGNISNIFFLLNKSNRLKLVFLASLQIIINLLDLIGVIIIGVVGALSVNGVQSKRPGTRVNDLLVFFKMENFTFQKQVGVLAIVATILLVTKTICSVIISRKTLFFLGNRSAEISRETLNKLLSSSIIEIQREGTQQLIFKINTGISILILSILGALLTLTADISLLFILGIGLFLINPSIAVTSIAFFGVIGAILYKLMHIRAQKLGLLDYEISVEQNGKLTEILTSYKEAFVRNRIPYYSETLIKLQKTQVNVLAEKTFMPNISKYVIEVSLILGTLIISSVQFLLQDAPHAIATLSIFLGAGSRIAPASLRIQQALIQIKTSLGTSQPTLQLINNLKNTIPLEMNIANHLDSYYGFVPKISVENVFMSYSSNSKFSLKDISLEIGPGESVAIVGASGSGKTTLVDLILGVISPDKGSIKISNHQPIEAIKKWPGAISYVPQEVLIVNKNIRENICLGFKKEEIPENAIESAVSQSSLDEFIKSLPDGIDTLVGERGSALSGGQRQRLGIARALITDPQIIVLDEATSSLDAETERQVSDSISNLKGKCTVVMIAHRLSSIINVDKIVYMENGSIIACGSFEDVRKKVPNFETQAQLMGL